MPTSIVLSEAGHEVLGVDVKNHIVETINKGISHISEKGLQKKLKKSIANGSFIARKSPDYSDVFLITVPTPFKKDSSKIPKPDLNYVYEAIKSCIPFLKKGNLIIIESTCPVGTTNDVLNFIKKEKVDSKNIYLAYCPERVLPGNITNELINNDRVVGGINKLSSLKAFEFYKTFCKGSIEISDSKTAEMVKLTENSYRDLNLAFANEISIICEKQAIDVNQLISIANKHPRVNILNPGCGVGGHCIAVDPWFLISQNINESNLLITSRKVNYLKTNWVVNKIQEKGELLQKEIGRLPNIGLMGMTFKANVGDIRNSPALEIVKALLKTSFKIMPYDPFINDSEIFDIYSIEDINKYADLIVYLVPHEDFKNFKFEGKKIIDFCGLTNNI